MVNQLEKLQRRQEEKTRLNLRREVIQRAAELAFAKILEETEDRSILHRDVCNAVGSILEQYNDDLLLKTIGLRNSNELIDEVMTLVNRMINEKHLKEKND